MPTYLSCPHGHRWQTAAGEVPDPDAAGSSCPVCGASAATPGPLPLSEQATVLPTPLPVLFSEQTTVPPRGPVLVSPVRTPSGSIEPPGYQILAELGRGAMGVVYKARQVRLRRLVALKMILAGGHAGEQELARFRSEAEAVARLQHPNIVQIYDVGDVDGLPFFSLELVEGGTLAGRLRGQTLHPQDTARLVETLARAMHYAHLQGVVHRDLKPGNILLSSPHLPGPPPPLRGC